MVYKARTPRAVLGVLLALTVVSIISLEYSYMLWLLHYQIIFATILLLLTFIKYEFKIDNGYLEYHIFFLTIPIYKKVLIPNEISQMNFKRIGWEKCAIINVKSGFNIRVINFAPNSVFKDLIDFAHNNSIPISKTKDILILGK
ncbi:hypothetical protein [Bacillus sp. FJAT-45037]|uniref:hypothetical protein n=1 Tax=Bacillus sp. FJAT-45037 TaxID=2011007 RepID=UPI000C241933|nr:hypothetical protein [Bacillus sp. FJAT-45037]